VSTHEIVQEYRIRAWLCAWALLLGAAGGWWVGLRVEFPPAYRVDATRYAEGYALWKLRVCTGQPPIRRPPAPCEMFANVNRLAIDPTEPGPIRGAAYSFFAGTRRIATRWMPTGAITCTVLLWSLLAWRNRRAWKSEPPTVHRNFFPKG